MSQCEAVPEDSPYSRRPPFLKQAAALRTQTKEIHKLVPRAVLCPMRLSAVMAMLHDHYGHRWLPSTGNVASAQGNGIDSTES